MTDKPLKAYAVQEPDEGTGGIVFAKSNAQARREGAQQFTDGDFFSVECRRLPWADKYAPGPVPFAVMLDYGWWQDCHGCGLRIEGEPDPDNEYGDGWPGPLVETPNGGIFCCPSCHDRQVRRWQADKRLKVAAINYARRIANKRCAGLVEQGDPYVYVNRYTDQPRVEEIRLTFICPGLTDTLLFRIDRKRHQKADAYFEPTRRDHPVLLTKLAEQKSLLESQAKCGSGQAK